MAHSFREAASGFGRAPLLTGLSAFMVGLALTVLGLFALVAFNLRLAVEDIEERVEVVAYLRESARPMEIDGAVQSLRALPGVEDVRFFSKAQALERARQELPEIADASADLEVNPFPASLEIRFLPGSRTTESVEGAAAAVGEFSFVEDVRYGREWVDRLFLLRRIGAITAMILGGAFAVVAVLIIGTAIRIGVFARRDEIFIMRLVGARDGLIRRPFLLEGAITGLVGGLMATLFTWGTYQAVLHFIFELEWIPLSWIGIGLLGGLIFGAMASSLAVRRYLREV
jgi:cell division transport system permease protein